MCRAQGPQRSNAGEAQTRSLWVLGQALYHWATALPLYYIPNIKALGLMISAKKIFSGIPAIKLACM